MPDRRRHRSAGPEDRSLFAADVRPRLLEACEHYAWLLDHGYAERSSLKLVGDRFELVSRQRDALRRLTCTASERAARRATRVEAADLRGLPLAIDGFNVLTTVESALGGGLVLFARDDCARDLASLAGTWRRVEETEPAIRLIETFLRERGVAKATWYLDAPVSNSGRLATLLRHLAQDRSWSWTVDVVPDPDRVLREASAVVASADRAVVDGCRRWTNLARELVEACVPSAWVLDVSSSLDR